MPFSYGTAISHIRVFFHSTVAKKTGIWNLKLLLTKIRHGNLPFLLWSAYRLVIRLVYLHLFCPLETT